MSCLEITTKIGCIPNFCTYCPQKLLITKYNALKTDKYMSLETFITCINKVPRNVEISFSGYTECFLNPLCSDMIIYAYQQGFKVNLYTTLSGMTIEDLEKIKDIKFHHISLHLPDNDQLMKVPISKEYLSLAAKFKEYFPKNNAHVYGKMNNELRQIYPNTKIQEFSKKNLHTRANNLDIVEIPKQTRLAGKIRCNARLRENTDKIDINVLIPNGDVHLCCMTYSLGNKLGNLLYDSYEDLFNSTEYKRIIQGLDDDTIDIPCRTCKEGINI